ncbi:MAG TPA: CehA/McbA family metallohydrolase [Protaetiibacter sp.]|nr:CehA/McbA family metallohydrolase [Protaetiibacter sp.]
MKPRVRVLSVAIAAVLLLAMAGSGGYLLGHSSASAPDVKPSPTAQPITAAVSGIVVDEAGDTLAASIEVTDTATSTRTRYQTDILGRFDVTLAAGDYMIEITKGYEYVPVTREVTVTDRLRQRLTPTTLTRGIDLAALGWHGGDLHQHSSYEEAQQDVIDILTSDLANGLSWGALTDHNTVDGLAEWMRAGRIGQGADSFVAIPGLEVTTDRGHILVLGTQRLIDPTAESTADIERIIAEARAEGATIQLNHPHLEEPMGFMDWSLHEQFDLLEIWNGKAAPPSSGTNEQSKQSWYALLNDGVFIPATADSDNHDIGGGYVWTRGTDDPDSAWMSRGLFSGDPRTYVQVDGPATPTAIIEGLSAGRSFLTNGPLVQFSLAGALPGQRVDAPSDVATLALDVFDRRGLTRVVVIENGVAITEMPLEGTSQNVSIDVPVTSGSWYLVEAFGQDGGYAITNPVFIS